MHTENISVFHNTLHIAISPMSKIKSKKYPETKKETNLSIHFATDLKAFQKLVEDLFFCPLSIQIFWVVLDIINALEIIHGHHTVTRLVQFAEGFHNYIFPCFRHWRLKNKLRRMRAICCLLFCWRV